MILRLISYLVFVLMSCNSTAQLASIDNTIEKGKLQKKICEANLVKYPYNDAYYAGVRGENPGERLTDLLDTEGLLKLQSSSCPALRLYSYIALVARKVPAARLVEKALLCDSSTVNFLDVDVMTVASIKKIVPMILSLQTRKELMNDMANIPQKNTSFQLEEGIYFEKLEPGSTHDNRFTEDNVIFSANKQFTFSYSYEKSGQQYLFALLPPANNSNYSNEFKLVPVGEKTTDCVTRIILTVKYGLQNFATMLPDYKQSVIEYNYLTDSYSLPVSEQTGLVENSMNLWLHPPRMMLFKILELNPFPFIMLPPRVNYKWKWQLDIGEVYADPRWKVWKGIVRNDYDYQTKPVVKLTTPFGIIDCVQTIGEAKSSLGTTALTSYFNDKYGFVKLVFTNIDSSTITMELDSISNKK